MLRVDYLDLPAAASAIAITLELQRLLCRLQTIVNEHTS